MGGDILEEPESGLPRFTDKQGIDGNLFPVGEEDVGEGFFIGFFTEESTSLSPVPEEDQPAAFGQDQRSSQDIKTMDGADIDAGAPIRHQGIHPCNAGNLVRDRRLLHDDAELVQIGTESDDAKFGLPGEAHQRLGQFLLS